MSIARLRVLSLLLTTAIGCQAAQPPQCDCDAAITKLGPAEFVTNGAASYTLLVDYNGNSLCGKGQLCVDDVLPAGLICDPGPVLSPNYGPSSVINLDWSCSCITNSIRCCYKHQLPVTNMLLPAIQLPVLIGGTTSHGVTNCASIEQGRHGDFADAYAANNQSCVTTPIKNGKGDIGITKSHVDPFIYGGAGAFVMHVTNYGAVPASNITVTDVLPACFTFLGTSSPGWTCNSTGQFVTCMRTSTLPPYTSATSLVLNVAIGNPMTCKDTGTNCAKVAWAQSPDANGANDSSCDPYVVHAHL